MAAYAATAHAYAVTSGMHFYLFFTMYSYSRIHFGCWNNTRSCVRITLEGLNRIIHVLRVTNNTLVTQWKC